MGSTIDDESVDKHALELYRIAPYDEDDPLKLTPGQLEYLLQELRDWSLSNGLAVRPQQSYIDPRIDPGAGALAITAPVTLFPSIFPRVCFDEAQRIQRAYNQLYAAIASDEGWLGSIVQEYAFSYCQCVLFYSLSLKIALIFGLLAMLSSSVSV